MAEIVKTLLTQILLRNDTEANWRSVDPILGKGEIAISSDVNQFKIGDGNSQWSALNYFEGNLATKVANLESELYGAGGNDANSRLDQLADKVNALEVTGGQANVLEVVEVKDEDIVTFDAATKTATIDLGAYAKSAALASYATTEYVNNELKSYATTNALTEAIKDFVTDGELATELAKYVTLEAYNLKVAALEQADTNLGARIDAIYKAGEGENAETGVLMDKLAAAANEVDAKLANYETAEVAQGKYETQAHASETYLTKADAQSTYETIANVNTIRETLNGTGEGEGHVPGLIEKVAANASGIEANANAILALQQAQAGGLVREIITPEELAELVADPSTAADNVIYMVPNQGAGTGEANDVYDEYIKVRTSAVGVEPAVYAIEFLGDTEVDLSQYYTKTEVDNKGYATTTYVDGELAKKVNTETYNADQNELKGRVDTVEAKLSDIAEGETVKAVIDAAVKVEADRAKEVEEGFEERIAAIEGLEIGTTYATKQELSDAQTTLTNNINTEKARIDTLVGKTEDSEGDAGKSVRTIAEEVHAANEVVKSAGDGLVIEDHVIKFAEGIFVLDGGNASLMASIETDENETV